LSSPTTTPARATALVGRLGHHLDHLPSTLSSPTSTFVLPSSPSPPNSLLLGLSHTESPLPLSTLSWSPLDPPPPAPNAGGSGLPELRVTEFTLPDLGVCRIEHGGDSGVCGHPHHRRHGDCNTLCYGSFNPSLINIISSLVMHYMP
jgi:hypothetical protein